jgi:Outer membrane protein beta-barrel domain
MHFQPNVLYTSASTAYVPAIGLGMQADIPITKHLYLQTGILFSRKGDIRSFSYANNDSFHETVDQKLGLAYAEAPINVTFKTGLQGRGRICFTIGIKPGYLLFGNNHIHATGVYAGQGYDTTTLSTVSNGKVLHAFDMALVLSAGYELANGWFVKCAYSPGINDIGLGGEVDKNRTLYLAAGRYLGKSRDTRREDEDLIDHGQ